MREYSRGKIGIITCEGGKPFGEKVLAHLEEIIADQAKEQASIKIKSREFWFSNGEVKTELEDHARNDDVYIIQDVSNSTVSKYNRMLGVNDHLMAIKTAIDAAKRADAHYITAVMPYFPYSRQDRKKTREGITAKQVAGELEIARANRVITLDIHNESIEGFLSSANFENLRASKCLIPYIKEAVKGKEVMVVAPDVGSVGRNEFYAKHLGTELGIVYKRRNYAAGGAIDKLQLLGDVAGKNVIITDDMIDTAGTIVGVAKLVKDAGANEIYLVASLPIFSGPAIEKINQAYEEKTIRKVFCTDAIYHGENFAKQNPWYDQVSVARLFAQAIHNINQGKSIRSLLEL